MIKPADHYAAISNMAAPTDRRSGKDRRAKPVAGTCWPLWHSWMRWHDIRVLIRYTIRGIQIGEPREGDAQERECERCGRKQRRDVE